MPNTAKSEAIRKAWGFEFYEIAKHAINEDGWFERNKDRNITLLTHFEVNEMRFKGLLIRPKSLDNIENNNGWIRIESEADLPKNSIKQIRLNNHYYGFNIVKDKILYDILSLSSLYSEYYQGNITHFQPIVKPEKPIY